MVIKNIDNLLEEVIKEAQELNIPVPINISKKVYINPRPKRRYGCCKTIDRKHHIEISKFVLEADEHIVKSVLAHEVLHTCEGCNNHGDRWKEYALRMNERYGYKIKRASTFAEMGISSPIEEARDSNIKYIIKCENCGKEYPRQRYTCVMKKINAYRCQCGGKLILINKYTR